jgi:hypothetical protein|tara:strand:+ start:115 stop:411 length:297 start_codon:yes stop_codon:yes gene_type:complete
MDIVYVLADTPGRHVREWHLLLMLVPRIVLEVEIALWDNVFVIQDVKEHFVRKSRLVPETPRAIRYAAETAFASMENVSAAMDWRVIVVRRVRSRQHR